MSWETFREETIPCKCGGGSVKFVVEMDDWNRTRQYKIFNCAYCKKEHETEIRQREFNREKRETLLRQAQEIAQQRYLEIWLARFSGSSKKQVWELITGGTGYPSLGTFYQHVRKEGLEKYLARWLRDHVTETLDKIGVRDEEISTILDERNNTPECREPHPWQ